MAGTEGERLAAAAGERDGAARRAAAPRCARPARCRPRTTASRSRPVARSRQRRARAGSAPAAPWRGCRRPGRTARGRRAARASAQDEALHASWLLERGCARGLGGNRAAPRGAVRRERGELPPVIRHQAASPRHAGLNSDQDQAEREQHRAGDHLAARRRSRSSAADAGCAAQPRRRGCACASASCDARRRVRSARRARASTRLRPLGRTPCRSPSRRAG